MSKELGLIKGSPCILTRSGVYFNILDPQPEQIRISDIASALSKLCRFTGHCNRFYSVAEHSIHVSKIVPEELKLEGLLHDATEAYLGDVSRPLKSLLPGYKKIEKNLDQVIRLKFGLPLTPSKEVKHADEVMLVTEARELEMKDWESWPGLPQPNDVSFINGLSNECKQVAQKFLERFNALMQRRYD